ncbi:sigma-70 family RNA polymerase sigma factor [Methylobacterium sp. Leaf102]|uniref:sigma-70 family RNA polymerase sigma factor n=1 Tax=Methylobacterium sp. Leaf102 TaxID=1736253 RepID=UPI00138F186F|nr:sigma-70 family RNA polymerase sigma factor [Methylobacterium sp. Leaf102]
MALLSGAFESVRIHLKSGEDVNVRDEKGRTPLILAATRGHDEVCRLLLQEGACLHIRDESGNDAASTAHARGHLEIEQLILNWLHLNSGNQLVSATEAERDITSTEVVGDNVIAAEIQLIDAPSPVSVIYKSNLPAAFFITPNKLGFDTAGDLDLSGWEEDVEAPTPVNDPIIFTNSVALHGLITRHVVIDTDEGWDEVEIDLPDPIDFRPRGIRLKTSEREDIRLLVVEALRDGRIDESRLTDLQLGSLADGDENRDNFHFALQMILGDLGVHVDDTDSPDPLVFPDEAEEETYGDAAYSAVAYLSRHLAGKDDPYFRFLATMPKERLSRAEEAALAEKRDQGFLGAMRALASCESVIAKLRHDLNYVLSGTIALRLLIDVDGGIKDDAADDDALENEIDPPLADAASSGDMETARMLFNACACAERNPEYLAQCMTVAGLRDRYFRELCDFTPLGSQARVSILAGLRVAEVAQMQLVEQNLRLVAHFANKWGRGLPRMDRLQEGTFGLIRAARKFSGTRGNKFATYAVWWIRQAIHRAAADTSRVIRLPVHVQEASGKVDKAVKALETRSIQYPSIDEIATECGLSSERVAKLLTLTREPISSADVEDEFFEILDPALGPEDNCNKDDLRRAAAGLLSTLDPRSERVVRLRFGIGCEEHTLEEIGQMYDVTRERIRQIEAKALKKLGSPGRCKHLRGAY